MQYGFGKGSKHTERTRALIAYNVTVALRRRKAARRKPYGPFFKVDPPEDGI